MNTEKFAGDTKGPKGMEGSLQPGSVLQGRYKITGVVGVGGMGSVYQAGDMHFPNVTRHVAVKEMLNLASDPNLREMTLKNFEREANILAKLSHPAIPKIFDYFSNKDRAYLVMEYINGRDLEAIINSMAEFLPLDMVRKWALELCDVLSYLHTHQPEAIIFRDVKPSNLMIDQQGNVRLIDFGIAKAFQTNQKGTMIGTEGYSPPEQYRGEASPAGDIYAVGATLHHTLTKRDPRLEPPFSFAERPIHQTNPQAPGDLEAIVMHALTYEPEGRYATATAMKAPLEALDRPASQGSFAQPREAASDTDSEFDESGAIPVVWKFKVEDEIRAAPTVFKGTLYVGAYDNNLYALNAADGAFKWKYATEGGIATTPAVSEEDNLIVFGSADHFSHAVALRTCKINWTFKTNAPIGSSVNGPLGHAFFGSDDGTLYAVRLNTGRLVWKFDAGAPIRSKPAVTSERIVFGNEEGDLIGVDLSGTMKWRFKAKRAITSSPAIQDDIAYVGSVDWHVYAVDVNNGWAAWPVRTTKPIVSSPLIVGNQLFVGSADNFMYALDINANGRELWKFEAKNQIVSSPVFANGAIYFGSVDQNIYSVETKKGKLRWSFAAQGPIVASGTLADGRLYIGSMDHTIYALNA